MRNEITRMCILFFCEKKTNSCMISSRIFVCSVFIFVFSFDRFFSLKVHCNCWHYSFIKRAESINFNSKCTKQIATNNLIGFYLCMCACLICDSHSLTRCVQCSNKCIGFHWHSSIRLWISFSWTVRFFCVCVYCVFSICVYLNCEMHWTDRNGWICVV